MQLDTTYRQLSSADSATARRALEKGSARFERLIEEPAVLRAVVEGGTEIRVTLSLALRGGDLTSSENGHDLSAVISEACDKMKVQLARHRHRREAARRDTEAPSA